MLSCAGGGTSVEAWPNTACAVVSRRAATIGNGSRNESAVPYAANGRASDRSMRGGSESAGAYGAAAVILRSSV